MDERARAKKKLAERVLGKGADLPLAMLLEFAAPVRALRDLARELGLSPKGFRVDKAPSSVLASLLAEQRDAKVLDRVLELLLHVPAEAEPADSDGTAAAAAPDPLAALRDAELARTRDEVERGRESLARAREREAELAQRLQAAEQRLAAMRAELAATRLPARDDSSRDDRALERRVHDLENEREGFHAADQALRRQLAHNQSRLRELEGEVAELEALLPKGKRRRKPQPEPPPDDRRFRLPRFTGPFYKSLEGKDRKAVERAIQAILLFCTEGHAYPGLEVKQLGGQDTWSLRASLGLRVYFRQLDDGDIELLELADREEQNTTLRRLKER